jgi:hypothetical protein
VIPADQGTVLACRRAVVVAAVLALVGCGHEPTAEEKRAAEERAIAQVEAVQKQKPPPRMIAPQPILYPDIEQHNLFEIGCAFAPGDSMGAVMLAREQDAYMKIGGRMVRFASDPGSPRMPLGTWSRYAGREMALALTKAAGEGEVSGSESVRWRGHLTVTDAFEQVVYAADGLVQCGS